MKEVIEFLRECRIFFLATLDEGKPRVRPFGAVSVFEDKLYFVTNNQKDVYKQLMTNPTVEICASKDTEWVRIEGSLIQDPRREAREQMLKENDGLEALYAVDDGLMEVLYLQDATATFSSFTSEPRTVSL